MKNTCTKQRFHYTEVICYKKTKNVFIRFLLILLYGYFAIETFSFILKRIFIVQLYEFTNKLILGFLFFIFNDAFIYMYMYICHSNMSRKFQRDFGFADDTSGEGEFNVNYKLRNKMQMYHLHIRILYF